MPKSKPFTIRLSEEVGGVAGAREPAHEAAQERLTGGPGGGVYPDSPFPRHRF
jgi:hypothetical protein